MPRYDVPRLADYSAAIQANNSMVDSFGKLGSISQNYLNYDQQNKQNAFDQNYNTNVFNETKKQNDITNANTDRAFNYGVQRDNVKDNQWQQNFDETVNNNKFDQNYKTNMFNHTVAQDNINNGFKQQQLNKPEYATFNGVDANGNPTLSMIDKNTGKVVNTGQQVYNESKKLAPEQSLYYMDRVNEMKQKQLLELEKTFRESNEFSNLEKEDQMKAIDYLRTNGKLPQISYDNSWLGKGYYLPMSEAVKQESKKVPKKDGSDIDLYKD